MQYTHEVWKWPLYVSSQEANDRYVAVNKKLFVATSFIFFLCGTLKYPLSKNYIKKEKYEGRDVAG